RSATAAAERSCGGGFGRGHRRRTCCSARKIRLMRRVGGAMLRRFDVVVIGAGAAGMMCAVEAGKRGRSVLVVDHAKAAGEKIRISGGGRCNFTNVNAGPENFLSRNPRFCISALRRYTPKDFIALVERHGIAWHEKTLGQLFCDGSARQIVDLFLDEMLDRKSDE